MANYQNHVVDPTFFFDAIEQFAFDYDLYVKQEERIDDYGKIVTVFEKTTIRGSLQSQGKSIQQSMKGNTNEVKYEFYCKSLYRIDIGDFINYKHKWLHVDRVNDYDEWGVRSVELTMVQLSAYKDLEEYVKYINGEIII